MDKLKAFFRGMASTLDIFGLLSPRLSDVLSDEEAIAEDWKKIGEDMWNALDIYKTKL